MRPLIEAKWLKRGLAISATLVLLAFALAGWRPTESSALLIRQLILAYLGLVVLRAIFFFCGTFLQRLQTLRLNQIPAHQFRRPLISIIMPCYNESRVIRHSLESLIALNYPNLEIIVVNDGSLDDTLNQAQFKSELSVRTPVLVLSQPNSGKAQALNQGLLHARGELILCVDADSRLNSEALTVAVRHFDDPSVGAVAGFVEISNQNNVLLLMQQLEYLVGLNFNRRAMSFLGIVPIVPGPAGIFRRQALLEVGGFVSHREIYAEDAELSLRLLTAGWKIKTEEEMIAVTEAPDTHQALLRQRYRWNRGTYQALLMNFNSLIASGWRGRWVALHLWLESVVTPILNFGLILYFLTYFFATGKVEMFTAWYFYLLAVDFLTTTIAVHRHGHFGRWWALTMFNKVYYFYMLLTWRLLSLYEEWLSIGMSWDKLDREGSSLEEAV